MDRQGKACSSNGLRVSVGRQSPEHGREEPFNPGQPSLLELSLPGPLMSEYQRH
jgi:hypothetical protein